MLKALTFLGLGDYDKTTYIKHDDPNETCETDLFPKAVAQLYDPDQIIAFTTEAVQKGKKDDLERLARELNGKFITVDIPNGNSEAQLWEIFQNCANAVDRDDKIILDITHAFRSIPLLVFIVAGYLRQVKQVRLKHIIYGAFEARDTTTDRTPIFDLTPFVQLLDWTNAVNVFQNSGDARPIAELDISEDISEALKALSEALLTNRTLEAQDAALQFNGLNLHQLKQVSTPFGMLFSQLQSNYTDMAVYMPSDNPKKSLEKQKRQIAWYVKNQHYLQAITLMREWLISYECLQQGDRWLSQDSRKRAEKALNERLQNQSSQLAVGLASLTSNQTLTTLWGQCIEVRNDLAHCGMRHDRKSAPEVIQAIETLFQEFEEFDSQI